MRATFYARVSTNSEEQKNSIESQISFFQSYIKERNYTPIDRGIFYKRDGSFEVTSGYYVDEGLSGVKEYTTRKAFMRMIEDAKAGFFDLILVKDIRRFGRNIAQTLMYFEELKKYNVYVYIQDIQASTKNHNDSTLINIFASLAETESVDKSLSVQFGKREGYKRGIWGGRAPMGYFVEDGRLIVHDEHAKVVKLIYDMYLKNDLGLRSIALELNKRGIKTQLEKTQWEPSIISKILSNKIYIGEFRAHRTRKIDIKNNIIEKVPESEQIVYHYEHLRIITDEEFNEVQRIKKMRNQKFKDFAIEQKTELDENGKPKIISVRENTRHSSKYLLSGLLRCNYCGGTQRRKVTKTKYKTYTAWVCNNYESYGKTKCAHRNLMHEHDILQYMKESLDIAYINNRNLLYNAYLLDKYGLDKEDDVFLEIELNKANQNIDDLIELRLKNHITEDEFQRNKQKFDHNRNSLEQRLLFSKHRSEMIKKENEEYGKMINDIKNINLDTATNQQLKNLLLAIIVDKEDAITPLTYIWRFMNKSENEILSGAREAIKRYRLKFNRIDEFYEVDGIVMHDNMQEFETLDRDLTEEEVEESLNNLEYLKIQ